MRLDEEANTLRIGVDDAQTLISSFPIATLQLTCENFRTATTVKDKLGFIGRFFWDVAANVHQPDPINGILIDFYSGAERIAPFIRREANFRLPEISAERRIIERKLSRKARKLSKDPENDKLKSEVTHLAKTRLTLRTLERIGKSEVAVQATPISTLSQKPEVIERLNLEFRSPDGSELILPPRPVQAD